MKKVVIVTIGMASRPARSAIEKQAAQRTLRGLAMARPTATSRCPKNTMVSKASRPRWMTPRPMRSNSSLYGR